MLLLTTGNHIAYDYTPTPTIRKDLEEDGEKGLRLRENPISILLHPPLFS
jgi:hypothetical protein